MKVTQVTGNGLSYVIACSGVAESMKIDKLVSHALSPFMASVYTYQQPEAMDKSAKVFSMAETVLKFPERSPAVHSCDLIFLFLCCCCFLFFSLYL